MPTVQERELGIAGYRAECRTLIRVNGHTHECTWHPINIFPSTALANDALQAHIDNNHSNQPEASIVGYVLPVDDLPLDIPA